MRARGAAWLAENRNRLAAEDGPDLPPYWREAIPALRVAHAETCAYSALRIPPAVTYATVDHFVPKSVDVDRAYDWANFRLTSEVMNTRKGIHTVLDPFELPPGAFHLRLGSGAIEPAPGLPADLHAQAVATIEHLKLDDATLRDARRRIVEHYFAHRDVAFLQDESPFVHEELRRQGRLA